MPKIIELARKHLVSADIGADMKIIAQKMLKHNVGSVVITQKDEILGFIDDKAILRLISDEINPLDRDIGELYSKFPTIKKNMGVLEAWDYVKDRKEERWGVVNKKNKIKGIVRKRTINDFRVRILKENLHIEDTIK